MKISHTMPISKVLADLCAIRQGVRIKNTLPDIALHYLFAW